MPILLVSMALAMGLGFAANRASICTVRAVAEVISTGRARMLLSTVKSVMWVLAITLPIAWLFPDVGRVRVGWAFSGLSLAGGFLFGTGAALNGACAFSTLNQLADGHLKMVMTLAGFGLGALVGLLTARTGHLAMPSPVTLATDRLYPWAMLIAATLALWGAFELARLWRTRPEGSRLTDLISAPRYRLSTTAAVIGLSNGALYLLQGSWSYTATLEHAVRTLFSQPDPSLPTHLLLFAAVLVGMVISTWQRGSLRIKWRPSTTWLRHLGGGGLMGLGALLVPGGNDSLVLYGIPSLSPHAAPAYFAILAGIFVTLAAMRRFLSIEMKVDCTGDVCTTSDA